MHEELDRAQERIVVLEQQQEEANVAVQQEAAEALQKVSDLVQQQLATSEEFRTVHMAQQQSLSERIAELQDELATQQAHHPRSARNATKNSRQPLRRRPSNYCACAVNCTAKKLRRRRGA